MPTIVRPERMVHGGRALARDPEGRVVLVAGALPGETVEIRTERRAGVAMGAVVRVLEAHPARVEPPDHPGLDLAFASYDLQLRLKAEVLADAARRAGVDLPDGAEAVRPSPRVWAYRSAIQPAVRDGRLGYRAEGSDRVVPLGEDPTALPGLNRAWRLLSETPPPASVREVALRGNDEGETLAALVSTAPAKDLMDLAHGWVAAGLTGVALAPWDERGRFRSGKSRLAGAREIRQRYGRYAFSVSATAFAQPNPSAAGPMAEALAAIAPGGDLVTELFAGGGLLSFHLAERYAQVVAIEIAQESVARGRRDAEREGALNVRFERGDARSASLGEADTIVVDPPRAGLAKRLREAMDASRAATLLYVSCDVATWARDAAAFAASGWRLDAVLPFDLQPHTHHLELATRFVR